MDWSIYRNLEQRRGDVPANYEMRFDPMQFLPEDIKEELEEISKVNSVSYTHHARERIEERNIVTLRRFDLNNSEESLSVDKSTSRHKNHYDSELGKDPIMTVQQVTATYNPITGRNEILRVNVRCKNLIETPEDDGGIHKQDSVLVMDIKKKPNGRNHAVMITGWMVDSNDYNYEASHKYTNRKTLNIVQDQIMTDYRRHRNIERRKSNDKESRLTNEERSLANNTRRHHQREKPSDRKKRSHNPKKPQNHQNTQNTRHHEKEKYSKPKNKKISFGDFDL